MRESNLWPPVPLWFCLQKSSHIWFLIFLCSAIIWTFKLPFFYAACPHSLQTWLLIFLCTPLMCLFNVSFLEAGYPHSPQTWFLIFSCTSSKCFFNLPLSEVEYSHFAQTYFLMFSCTPTMCRLIILMRAMWMATVHIWASCLPFYYQCFPVYHYNAYLAFLQLQPLVHCYETHSNLKYLIGFCRWGQTCRSKKALCRSGSWPPGRLWVRFPLGVPPFFFLIWYDGNI